MEGVDPSPRTQASPRNPLSKEYWFYANSFDANANV